MLRSKFRGEYRIRATENRNVFVQIFTCTQPQEKRPGIISATVLLPVLPGQDKTHNGACNRVPTLTRRLPEQCRPRHSRQMSFLPAG